MKHFSPSLYPAALIAICVIAASAARADDGDNRENGPNRYLAATLTSDIPGAALNTDPVLQNAWGVAFTPAASPFWVADNATGCSTLYDGQGAVQALQVKLPLPGGSVPPTACKHVDPNHPPSLTPAAPTGLVWNPTTSTTTGFLVPGTSPPLVATFIWDTEDGTISAWTGGLNPSDQAVLAVDNSPGAVYKGLVFGVNANGVFLFATNFRAGTVDVFDQPIRRSPRMGGSPIRTSPPVSRRSASRISTAISSSPTPSKTPRSTTTWRVRATALSTCSTPMAICCDASRAGGRSIRLGPLHGRHSPLAVSAATSSLAISAMGK
jgi:hypothetical protein